MSPIQIAADILATIPRIVPCCSGTQQVPAQTLEALRNAISDAADEERILYGTLHRCLPLVRANVVRMQAEADGAASLDGKPNPTAEQWLVHARELFHAVNARVGEPSND